LGHETGPLIKGRDKQVNFQSCSSGHQKKTSVLSTQAFPWPRYRAPMYDLSAASTSGAGFRAARFKYRALSGISQLKRSAFCTARMSC
jgi:hypothetical protein